MFRAELLSVNQVEHSEKKMKAKLVAVGFAIASSLLPLKAIAASYEGLNVFGDSLVDSGNLFDLTSAFSFLGVPGIPPSPPYAQKFSNGPIWIDQVG